MASVGVAFLVLTGCSTGGSSLEAASKPRVPTLLKSVDLRLPLEDYLFSDAERMRLDEGRAALINKCLRRFEMRDDFKLPGMPPGPRSLMDRRYGLTDEAAARTHGYHLRDDPRGRSATSPPEAGTAAEKKRLAVLQGADEAKSDGGRALRVKGMTVPAGGCVGEADREIAGKDRLGPGELARSANFQTFDISKRDPRVTEVFKEWSECMKKAGHSYPDPLAAMSDSGFQGKSSTRAESKVAVADVDCKRQTNLIGIWFTIETAVQKELIRQKKSDFSSALKAKKSQLAKAAAASGDQ
ncbi:hypothetical protein FFZ77_05435 [Streptomyces katsurahamanus]|uniref:Lipoprotein n=1 Tax=Streptomyces katsurahamanus TaxID=2577098 RepID=A0ABW9NP94_9ACTN|nr:hypothetical protein [Streptomyces katsurahamanus]